MLERQENGRKIEYGKKEVDWLIDDDGGALGVLWSEKLVEACMRPTVTLGIGLYVTHGFLLGYSHQQRLCLYPITLCVCVCVCL